MRVINKIIIHCAATQPKMDIGAREIRQWHLERGWSDIGYHYVIRKDGTVETGRPIWKVGSHCLNQNTGSIGICYVGGWEGKDDRTDKQKEALKTLITKIENNYGKLEICGHNEFSTKTCPNFNVKEEYGN